MKFKLTAITAILALLIVTGAQAANLLTNPGFEDYPSGLSHTGGWFTEYNWRYFSVVAADGTDGSFQTVTPGRTGNIAVKLTRSSTSRDTGLDKDGFFIPVTPGVRYRASFWAKSPINSSIKLTLAPYDSNNNWLGQQKEAVFTLGTDYANYYIDYIPPTGTASMNYALRVSGIGTVYIDDCSLDIAPVEALVAPTVTYPVNDTVDSFKPTIGFKGSGHDGCQVIITRDSTLVWDSGTQVISGFSLACTTGLLPSSAYKVKVRLRRGNEWSEYSPESDFTTPAGPIARIISPAEADTLRGPSVTVKWQAESPTGIAAQTLTLDDGTPITVQNAATTYTFANITEGIHKITLNVTSSEGTATDTSRFCARITPAETGTIYYLDLSYVLNYNKSIASQRNMAYDIPMAVYALQGIVNRSGPKLWIYQFAEDSIWWNRMRESGNWLANKTVTTIPTGSSNLATLINTFRDDISGVVLWDPNLNATANIACTVAGADNLLPVRYDPTPGSVYSTLVTSGPMLPVVVDLTGKFTGTGTIPDTSIASTGSKKCDAYTWARARYLETGKCNPEIMMYAVDGYWLQAYNAVSNPGHTLPSRDYVIQNKGFFFDLNVWGDEKPVDDPSQPLGTDLSTLRSILYAVATRAPGMVHVAGFVPWPMKYTNYGTAGGTHEPVATEWEYAKWLSQYNAYMDADAYGYVDMANASIFSRFPLPDRLTQNRKLSPTDLRKLGYLDKSLAVSPLNFLNIYMGDYDSACWVEKVAYQKWSDPNRGKLPLSWGFDPNHIRRIAAVIEYYYRTRSDMDSFIAGDCGAGYINPSCLLGTRLSGLPSAKDIWIAHNLKYNRATNTKMAGFLINGTNGPITSEVDDMFSKFSPEGIFSQPLWYPQGNHMSGSMPALLQQRDLTGNYLADTDIIYPDGVYQNPNFLNYRTVLQSPSYVKNLYSSMTAKDTSVPWTLVDAPVYAALASRFMGKTPDARATYTFDVIPQKTVIVGDPFSATIGIRNDGWVDWDSSYSLMLTWKLGTQIVKRETIPLPRSVPSGSGIVVDFTCTAPTKDGNLTFCYEMAKNGTGFSELGDYNWETPVTVEPSALVNTPASAKTQPDGTQVTLWDTIVTAGNNQLASTFYTEDKNRVCGIRVDTRYAAGISVSEGDRVRLKGTVSGSSSERVITSPVLLGQEADTLIQPLAIRCGAIGGSAFSTYTLGITGMSGVNNLGLLVKTWGRVTYVNTSSKYFYLDDGSGPTDYYGHKGIYIRCGGLAGGGYVPLPALDSYVSAAGIVFRATIAGKPYPALLLRKQSDLQILAP